MQKYETKKLYPLSQVVRIINRELELTSKNQIRYNALKRYINNGYILVSGIKLGYNNVVKYTRDDIDKIREFLFYNKILHIDHKHVNSVKEKIIIKNDYRY